MTSESTSRIAPLSLGNLKAWIRDRIQEPCAAWAPTRGRAKGLPVPVNLPGMERAAAAVLAKYPHMPSDWHADVIQDFSVYLLRPQTLDTLADSAARGLQNRQVKTLEQGIAWKLRQEILSRAHRAYEKHKREAEIFVETPSAKSGIRCGAFIRNGASHRRG